MNFLQRNVCAKLKLLFLIPVLGMFLLAGCSSTSKTVTTESKTYADDSSAVTAETKPSVKTEETTTTTTEQKAESHSLLGSVFNFLGEVIAFPFRVVGGIFDAIF